MKKIGLIILAGGLFSYHINDKNIENQIKDKHWGPKSRAHLFTLRNNLGMTVEFSDYGATITKLEVPNKSGILTDVVLGFGSQADQIKNKTYFGCIVGRYANRISQGRFSLFGHNYQLSLNNYPSGIPCCLHGGKKGFNDRIFQTKILENNENQEIGIQFKLHSKDGDQGFPGALDLIVKYWLKNNSNTLRIEYESTVQGKPTVVNFTNHCYFNLHGESSEKSILDQFLQINSSKITPVDKGLIPTGNYQDVENTAFDFRGFKQIGQDINKNSEEQIAICGGYDHNFVIKEKNDGKIRFAASAFSKITGIVLEVFTSEPGVQLYTSNAQIPNLIGKSSKPYNKYAGFCLETQHFPDSPNQQMFPSVVLKPGEIFKSTTILEFGTLI